MKTLQPPLCSGVPESFNLLARWGGPSTATPWLSKRLAGRVAFTFVVALCVAVWPPQVWSQTPVSDRQTSGQDAPATVTPPPEDAPKTNKAVGVIVTRSGKTINVSPSTKVDSNYWTPDKIHQFWTAEEARRAKELEHQANLRREAERAERARLEAEQKAALEKKLQPRKLAAQMPPEEVTRLLRHALRQATLDRGMESPDKHTYVFEFPPQSGQPESLAAEQVARNNALREAWLEASLVSIQESPKGNTYTFAFPTNVLARLGLFKEGSRQ